MVTKMLAEPRVGHDNQRKFWTPDVSAFRTATQPGTQRRATIRTRRENREHILGSVEVLSYVVSLLSTGRRLFIIWLGIVAALTASIINSILLVTGSTAFMGPYPTVMTGIAAVGLLATGFSTLRFLMAELPGRLDHLRSRLEELASHDTVSAP